MGIRISEMEEATTFGADDYVPIVTNGTNKKALGSKIKDFIAGFFVSKSGDTMTGNLRIHGDNQKLYVQDDRFDETASVSSTLYNTSLSIRDKNNKEIGIVQGAQTSDGNIMLTIGTSRRINGTTYENFIRTRVDNTGAKSYGVSDAAAFREAIHISRTYCGQFTYDSTYSRFPLSGNPRPIKINGTSDYPQLTLLARNRQTGAIYAVWYNGSVDAFLIAATISGNAPSNGNKIELQYFAE